MKNSIASGYVCTSDHLKPIIPVLESWFTLVNKYSTALNQDACWWYNERASISVLSGAAWRTSDWIALEEFSTKKHGENGGVKHGRCDLYLSNKTVSFVIEAKQAWQNIGDRTASNTAEANRMFALAWEDAAKLSKTEADHRLAACFIVPRLPEAQVNEENTPIEERLDDWLENIKTELKPDTIAWVFPEGTRNLTSSNDRIFPGVCLVLKERRRAKVQ